jgi:cellulose synthase (UDP-forming)
MQVLRTDNPMTLRGLSWPQRLAYAFTLLGWFDAWRTLGYLLVPVAVLCTGAVPIQAPLGTFAVAFAVTFTLQQLALWLLGRGWQRPWLALLFELVRLPSNLAATTALFTGRRLAFQVTPKGRTGDRPQRARPPRILLAAVVVSAFAALWFIATVAGRTPLRYGVPAAAYAAAGWLAFNLALVTAAIARICAIRYGGERRASVRFPEPDGRQAIGVQYQPGQWPAIGALTHLLFNAGVGLEVVPAPAVVGAAA